MTLDLSRFGAMTCPREHGQAGWLDAWVVGKEDANFGWVQLSSTGPASTIFLVLDLVPIRYPQRQ